MGAGPAGATAALGALRADPTLRVLLLDRADFPRDKSCGDGIAPHVLDELAVLGVHDVTDGWAPVRTLELTRGASGVSRDMARPAWVVPREVFDARLVEHAVAAGAVLRRHRVRSVEVGAAQHDGEHDGVVLDGRIHAAGPGRRRRRPVARRRRGRPPGGGPPGAGAARLRPDPGPTAVAAR